MGHPYFAISSRQENIQYSSQNPSTLQFKIIRASWSAAFNDASMQGNRRRPPRFSTVASFFVSDEFIELCTMWRDAQRPRGLDHGFDYGNFESFDDILTASHNLSTVEMRNKLNEIKISGVYMTSKCPC